jgi:non-heme chloroperoxidase
MNTYADDLAALTEKLDLRNAIHVGHSTGGGEVARYIGRHGTKRVAMAVLISSVPPLMLTTNTNPAGAPTEVFDGLRAAYLANRPQFYRDITLPFYGYNRPGDQISEGIRDKWWLQGMMGDVKAGYDCIKASRSPISLKILRSSTYPPSSLMATTIRSCLLAGRPYSHQSL